MTTDSWKTVLDLVDEALTLDTNERDTFLLASSEDPGVRAAAARLIEAHDVTRTELSQARHGHRARACEPVDTGSVTFGVGSVVGPYTIVDRIGQGGMGDVYLAEQSEPVSRRVALKLVRAGEGSTQLAARFEVECQLLALMDHPNVAKVFEVGRVDVGGLYLAMEYIDGPVLTDYCDQQVLSTRDRLELFVQVCRGVHHAHQKGIVHRDIKPANILVVEQDGRPQVKIIDFGVAKALDRDGPGGSDLTEFGALVGTPIYMSPEQAAGGSIDVDSRSDVYALGVLLHELLVGVPPFDVATLHRAGYHEILRRIREDDPPRLSQRIQRLEAGGDVAKLRSTTVAALRRMLAEDLDWIAAMALDKERSRRYDSASGLADDVERFLRCEPVLASPPTRFYRLSKLIRKHKAASAAAAAVVLMYVFGFVILMTIGIRASMELDDYRDKLAAAEKRVEDLSGSGGEIGTGLEP